MSGKNKFEIAMIAGNDILRPFFIIETYPTSDGLRSRICSGRYKSFVEAKNKVEEYEQA